MIPTLLGVASLTFVIMRVIPGDVVALRYSQSGSAPQEVIDRERALLGLDRPMHEQYIDFMAGILRSEEHTSELQSQSNLVCRLLLEKKKKAVTVPVPERIHVDAVVTAMHRMRRSLAVIH